MTDYDRARELAQLVCAKLREHTVLTLPEQGLRLYRFTEQAIQVRDEEGEWTACLVTFGSGYVQRYCPGPWETRLEAWAQHGAQQPQEGNTR